MEILLINSPIRLNAKPNCIPYGLATIASTLRNAGFDVEIYDINALRPSNENIIQTLKKTLKKGTWDLIGLSGLITTYGFQKWLISEIKKINPATLIVSGGGLATSGKDLLFQNTEVDVVVLGEGEQTMLELCNAVEKASDLDNIPGIAFRSNGHIVMTEPRTNVEDLDEIPFPAWDLLPLEVYLKNPIWGDVANNSSGFNKEVKVTHSMNIIASRGCPFSCNYCYHLFGRSNYRFRSPQNIVKEIEFLLDRYGVDFIGFVDDNMMVSERRLLEFCDLMEQKNFPVKWGCHSRVTSAKPDVLKRMAEAGCIWIGYGIESGSQRILDAMNKKATVEQAKRAILDTRKVGIYPNTTFIFGYPGETLETIQETIDFKKELAIECSSFFVTPYPGAPLYEQIRSQIMDEVAYVRSLGDATEFSINLTSFDDKALIKLKETMDSNLDVL